ncbi:MAG: metallopeptidase family protein [Oscillospiraceae bacterium]|nr:metallopeptidase family protein [Oscillospiraceae bacterium]
MFRFEEVGDMLDEIAERFPKEFYEELNGGILLLRGRKRPDNYPPGGRVYVMGQYCRDQMGRYIKIYYGSFMALYGDLDREALMQELYDTLAHEFTHHMEGRAGERGLEIKDALEREAYLDRWHDQHDQRKRGGCNGDDEGL